MTSFEEKLAALHKPSVEFPQHKAQLRRALLNSERLGSNPLFMSFYKLIPATLVLALVFGLSFALRPQALENVVTPKASAEELVNDTLVKVQALNADQLAALAQKLGLSSSDEMFATLKEAAVAPNLAYADAKELNCAEVEKLETGNPAFSLTTIGEDGTGPAYFTFIDGKVNMDVADGSEEDSAVSSSTPTCTAVHGVHLPGDKAHPEGYSLMLSDYNVDSADSAQESFLTYTNSAGYNVLLGLDGDLFPFMTYTNNSQGEQSSMTFTTRSIDSSGTDEVKGQMSVSEDGDSDQTDSPAATSTGCTSWSTDDGKIGGGGC